MAQLYRDFMRGALSSAIGASDLTLASAGFGNLPVVSGGDEVWITLDPDGLAGDPEVVKVDAHTGSATSLTVSERGVGSSTAGTSVARSHAEGTLWAAGLHAVQLLVWDANISAAQATADAALPLAGGTVVGPVSYAADPTADNHLARKSYVDDTVAQHGTDAGRGITARIARTAGFSESLAAGASTGVQDAIDVTIEEGRLYRVDFQGTNQSATDQRQIVSLYVDGAANNMRLFEGSNPAQTGGAKTMVSTTHYWTSDEFGGAGTYSMGWSAAWVANVPTGNIYWVGDAGVTKAIEITWTDVGPDPDA